MSAETIFIFSMAIVLLHIKPGPGQAMRVATALKEGFWPAMAIAFGVALICNFYLVVASVGANVISTFLANTGVFFRIAAAAYLIYLGYKGLRSKPDNDDDNVKIKHKTFIQYFFMGCIISLSNPIDIFFFMGILPGLVEFGTLSTQNIITFMVLMTVITLVIDVLILGMAAQSKTTLANSGFGKTVGMIANAGLILIGLFLLYTAFINPDYSFNLF